MQMKLMKVVLLVCVCLSLLPAQCVCFSRGASTATCMDMKPGHISAQPQHTHTASAVTIHTSRTVYLPQHTLMVSVRSSRAFMGLLLHARSVVEDRVVGGKFTLHPPGTHTLSCLSTADTVTHSDKLLKRNLSFTWRAPAQPSGDLRFYITVVHSYFVYWTRIHSAVVHDGTRKTRPGLQIGIISASPTSSTLTHTSVHAHSEHSNTTHDFLTHTDKHTSTYPSNRVTHTQLYTMTHTHNHIHTTKGSVNTLHVHTHTHSRPDIAYTQKHAATTPVTHTHTSPNTMLMSHSLTTHTPRTHAHSPSAACTSPGITMVTLITPTYTTLRRSVSDPVEPRDDPEVFVKLPDPEPHPESGIKTGGGVKAEPGVGFVSQPVMLMVLSLVLLVLLAVYVQRKHCVRRNGVSLSDSRQESAGVRRVQECGELVQLRRIRENSLLLLQAQYDIITAPGN
ncbi:hypothetical protein Q7C36_018797 [Tachysurus vachellii]|uniref:Reelin domain-containing protein n=1 Tax=Tachysurus vachellii TaxID=175792 RepID=A0AA88LVA7_TACVA|nr:hypothetical protein Q7C36_018797 [Tachysurus vachellii]